MPTPAQLAARHLKLTFWGGLVLVIPMSIIRVLSMDSGRSWPGELPMELRVARDALGFMRVLALWAAPSALLAGWLRLRPMRWLFGLPQLYVARSGGLMGVGSTFLAVAGTNPAWRAAVPSGWRSHGLCYVPTSLQRLQPAVATLLLMGHLAGAAAH